MTTISLLLGMLLCSSPTPEINAEQQLRAALDKLTHNAAYQLHDHRYTDGELHGDLTLFDRQRVQLTAQFSSANELQTFELVFPAGSELGIGDRTWQKLLGRRLTDGVPESLSRALLARGLRVQLDDEQQLERLHLDFTAVQDWPLLKGAQLALEEVLLRWTVDYPNQSARRKFSGTLTGVTRLGSAAVNLQAEIQPKKEDLLLTGTTTQQLAFAKSLTALVGTESLLGLSLPDGLIDFKLDKLTLGIQPYRDRLTIDGRSNWAHIDGTVWRSAAKKPKTEYLVAIVLDKDTAPSKLHPGLGLLDALPLGGQKIVLSSAEKKKSEKSGPSIPSLATIKSGIQRGCQLISTIDMRELGMAALTKVQELEVTTLLNKQLKDVVLVGDLDTAVPVGPTTELSGVQFRLTPAPNRFAVALVGTMDVEVDKDRLPFGGGMEVGIADQSLKLLADGPPEWDKPYGLDGLRVSNLQLEFGASFTTAPVILPQLGISGDLDVGGSSGAATVVFDTRNPQYSMIDASLDQVNFGKLYGAVIPPNIRRGTPKALVKVLDGLSLKNVQLKLVPVDMTVMGRQFEAGFTVGGELHVNGWKGNALIDVDPKRGFLVEGGMDPIGNKWLGFTGAKGNARPELLIELRKGQQTRFMVNGKVTVLGIEALTDVSFEGDDLRFVIEGKVFDLFEGEISVQGRNLAKAEDLQVKVAMKNRLLQELTNKLSDGIEQNTANAVKRIRRQQQLIDMAQTEVDNWKVEIARIRKIAAADQADDRAKIAAARAKVDKAEGAVRYLRRRVRDKEKQLANTPKTLRNAVKRGAIRADIARLVVSRETADKTLDLARLGLKGLYHLNVDPDKDTRVIAARASQKAATALLQTHRKTLDVYLKTRQNGGKLAMYVVENGVAKAVDVRSASFEGRLGTVHGGAVRLQLEVLWLGKVKRIDAAFDFRDMAANVKTLLRELRKG